MPADCRRFAQMIPNTGHREKVKPGITGMAQCRGLHGNICDRNTLLQRYYWDDYYVQKANFFLDIAILWNTILTLLTQRRPGESTSKKAWWVSVFR
jgi:putative colanic acid biosynthesis UDP-glucose lipid carrier transferase